MGFKYCRQMIRSHIAYAVGFLITQIIAPATIAGAMTGTGSTGGGNLSEADFTSTAREILAILDANPATAARVLRTEAINEKFLSALDTTEVHCSYGKYTELIRNLNKIAFFDAVSDSIYLDCERYEEFQKSPALKSIVIFHEYMRKLGLEGSNYRISSNLPRLISKTPTVAQLDQPTQTCAAGMVYSRAHGCLPQGQCPPGYAQDPLQPAMCTHAETGTSGSPQQCGAGYLLTNQGCRAQCPGQPGYGLNGDTCIPGIKLGYDNYYNHYRQYP